MKRLLFALVAVLLCGCDYVPAEPTYAAQAEDARGDLYPKVDYRIVVIDGCEYIATHQYQSEEALTHKGNCKNH